ncbi:major facilitator superfamily domain-containing protein [Xylariomycetidae sp. FL2044]|nr:major facilitator superfamily domain-containing protein [Xylariomycetidae sp. FL2044]
MTTDDSKTLVVSETAGLPDAGKLPVTDPNDIYIDPQRERRLLWKIDAFLVPLLTLFFLSAYLDRSNIGNAKIAGMPEELSMNDQQFATARLAPRQEDPAQPPPTAVVHAGLLYASRLLIGLFEAGMYPALAITLTTFYTPKEQARRFAYLYLSVGLSGGFGGLFAFALLKLDGRHGISGWRWLYIVEGALSIGVAILLWGFMPDTYEDAKFLNDDDRELMRLRSIKHDRYMRLSEVFDKREVAKTFRDPKIWVSALVQFLGDILSFGTSTFMPSLVRSFGFDSVLTQVLTVPIFFWAVAVFIGVSMLSDKLQKRAAFMFPGAIMVAVGYALLLGLPMSERGGLYFACFIVVSSIYVMLGSNYVWMLGSHAGYYKRATAIGINMTVGNAAGLVIAQIFKDTAADGRYLVGEATSLGCALACAGLCLVLYTMLRRQNVIRESLTEEQRQQWIDEGHTGDAHPDYRYML